MEQIKESLLNNVDQEEKADIEKSLYHAQPRQFRFRITYENIQRLPSSVHLLVEVVLLLVVSILAWDNISLRYHFWQKCLYSTNAPSPLLDVAPEVSTTFFNGSFGPAGSPWRRPPSPEVDAMWLHYIRPATQLVAMPFDEVRKMGKIPEDVIRVPARLRSKYGNGVLVAPEFSHQLHCLNVIRKFTYFDYYKEEIVTENPSPLVRRVHIDHCIDMLRQVLMCKADTGFITNYWVSDRKLPMPDFNTMHKCRNIDAMVDWLEDRSINRDLGELVPTTDEKIWTRKHGYNLSHSAP